MRVQSQSAGRELRRQSALHAWVEGAVHAVPLFVRRGVEVEADTEVEGEAAAELPVVLEVRSDVPVLPPREERVVGGTLGDSEQEGRVAVPTAGVTLVPVLLREGGGAVEVQDVAGVLDQVVDLANVHAALQGVAARDLGGVGRELVGVGEVVALAAAQSVVVGKSPDAEVNGAGKLTDEGFGQAERTDVEALIGAAVALFDEAVVRPANVDDEGRGKSGDPVCHIGVVDALEGLLAIGAGLVIDAVDRAVLGAVVGCVAEESAVLVAKVPVELEDQVVEVVHVEVIGDGKVAGGIAETGRRRPVGQRHVLGDRGRDGMDHARRDDVARERLANRVVARVQRVVEGVVDGDRQAAGVDHLGEVALAHLRLGPGDIERVGSSLAVVLEAAQVEELDAPIFLQKLREVDRAFELEAVLVEVVIGPRRAAFGVAGRSDNGIVLEGVGVQGGAAHEFPAGAVKRVGAALEHHVHDAAAGVAVLGVVEVHLHDELLHGIHDGHVGDVVAAHLAVVGGAVEHELGGGIAAAVDGPLGDGAVIEGALPDGRAAEGDAGHHDPQHERVPRIQGHFGHLLSGDHAAAGGGLGFEHGRFRDHLDGFGHGADFQADVDASDSADFQNDVLTDVLLEPGRGYGHRVVAGTQERDGVRAGGVAGGRGRLLGGDVDGLDLRVGDGGTTGVIDVTRNGGAKLLGQRQRGEQAQEQNSDCSSCSHFGTTP